VPHRPPNRLFQRGDPYGVRVVALLTVGAVSLHLLAAGLGVSSVWVWWLLGCYLGVTLTLLMLTRYADQAERRKARY
jgi:hypothetical protein